MTFCKRLLASAMALGVACVPAASSVGEIIAALVGPIEPAPGRGLEFFAHGRDTFRLCGV